MPELILTDVFSGNAVKTCGTLKPAPKTPTLEPGFLAMLLATLSRNGNEEEPLETVAGTGSRQGIFMGKTIGGPAPEGEEEIEEELVEPDKTEKTFFTGPEEATLLAGGYPAGFFPVPSSPGDAGVGDTPRLPGGEWPEQEQTAVLVRWPPEKAEDATLELEEKPRAGGTPDPVHAVTAPVGGQVLTGEAEPSVAVAKHPGTGTAEHTPEATVAVSGQAAADTGGDRLKAAAGEKNTGEPEAAPKPTAGKETTPNPAAKRTFSAREGSYSYHPLPDTVTGPPEEMLPPEGLGKPAGTGETGELPVNLANRDQNTLVSLEPTAAQEKKQGAERVEKLEAGLGVTSRPAMENVPVEQEKAEPVPRFLPPEKVIGQILQGARMMVKNGAARIRLHLQPPELGRLELALVIERETVTARFTTQSRTVQALIEANLPELRSNLQDAGLHVDQLQVEVENGFDSHPQSASGGQPQEEASSIRKMPGSFVPVYDEAEPETGEEKWIGRINLRV